MSAMNCPNCGGPAQIQPGQTTIPCTFCGRTFQVPPSPPPYAPPPSPYAAPPPAWGPPQQQPIPQIVIVAPGETYGTPVTAAASFVGMRLLFGLLPVGITLIVAAVIAFSSMRGLAGGGGLSLGGWNGSGQLLCGGNDTVSVSGINTNMAAGPIINAGGNCHVTCQGCTLRSSVVIAAAGNAQIDLIDSHIEGSDSAIVAGGNAQVRMTGSSTLVGKVVQGGNASITAPPGASGNAAAPPPAAAKPPSPVVTSSPSHAAPGPAPSKHR
jgi:hypothetical protein